MCEDQNVEICMFLLMVPRKLLIAIIVNRSLLGMRPMTAFSIERDWVPLENESFQFDSSQVKRSEFSLQSLGVGYQDPRVGPDVPDIQFGVKKFKSSLRISGNIQ